MATLTRSNINDIGTIVRQAISDVVPKIIEESVPAIIKRETAGMREDISSIHKDISDLRENSSLIKLVQGNQSITMRTMQTDLSQLRQLAREQGIMHEDLYHDFLATSELLSENLNIKTEVTDHDSRLTTLATTGFLNKID